jgi:dolichyl-phosphate-mannose--protein O-mannosyl transferase
MFGKTAVATCATLLLGFEFMRFVQSRIGTIDTYTVLFILLSFFFMYRYITTEKDADFRESLAPLALSGFFFGLSFAIKWIGFYAGAGLFIIYVIRLAQLAKHYRVNERDGFGAYLTKTLLFSLGFFVIVPVTIYYLTYIPYGLAEGMTLAGGMLWSPRFLQLVWDNQIFMFDYHSRLVLGAEHPFSSEWWQWLFNIRPVLYVNTAAPDGVTRATFGAFGNPVVYWGGLLAMLVMAVRVFTHRDGKALFILIGYLSQLLPWIAVSRILFAYHYFPGTLFLILALAHVFNTILSRSKRDSRAYVYGYTAITGVVFAIFYPSISGMFMPHWYYSNLIKWLNTWPF